MNKQSRWCFIHIFIKPPDLFILLILFVGLTFANIAAINLFNFSGIQSTESDPNDNVIQENNNIPKLAEYKRTVEDTGKLGLILS